MLQKPIYSEPIKGLKEWFLHQGEKSFRALQLAQWVYKEDVVDFGLMTNISEDLRKRLSVEWSITRLKLLKMQKSSTDGTRKLLFELSDGETIETVLIPDEDRLTLCVSSQVGCKMGCKFCLTAEQKLSRNLKSDEIVAQFLEAKRILEPGEKISNIVFMGMGEPLDNFNEVKKAIYVLTDQQGIAFGRRKIAISTVGVAPMMARVVKDLKVRLVLSLNATNDELRKEIMPITIRYSVDHLIKTLRELPISYKNPIMIAYTLMSGVNDSDEDAYKLAKLLKGIPCKINIIPYNPFPGSPYSRPSEERWRAFHKIILNNNFIVTTRISGGLDILAACGQLRSYNKQSLAPQN